MKLRGAQRNGARGAEDVLLEIIGVGRGGGRAAVDEGLEEEDEARVGERQRGEAHAAEAQLEVVAALGEHGQDPEGLHGVGVQGDVLRNHCGRAIYRLGATVGQ